MEKKETYNKGISQTFVPSLGPSPSPTGMPTVAPSQQPTGQTQA